MPTYVLGILSSNPGVVKVWSGDSWTLLDSPRLIMGTLHLIYIIASRPWSIISTPNYVLPGYSDLPK